MSDSNKQRIALISKPQKAELAKIVPELVQSLLERGAAILADPATAQYLRRSPDRQVRIAPREELAAYELSFAIVLGGDGTLLAAARTLARSKVPILAVNLGSLGFLTEVRLEDLYPTLDAWLRGQSKPEPRAMLHCEVMRADRCVAEYEALNDIVVAKGNIARIADLTVSVNGAYVANYKADGLIVATPTGSTAYSLAAGGPVLSPDVRALVITPISPHALTNRPLVITDAAEVLIRPNHVPESAFLTVDGQEGLAIDSRDEVRCRLSHYEVQLIRNHEATFFDVLRTKLKWGER